MKKCIKIRVISLSTKWPFVIFFFFFFLKKILPYISVMPGGLTTGLGEPFSPIIRGDWVRTRQDSKIKPSCPWAVKSVFCFLEQQKHTPHHHKVTSPKKTLFFENCYQKFLTFSHMSLHIFKETLKPCTKNPSSSLNSTSKTQSFDPIIPRKPPKSSLSRQLLRLQDPEYLPQLQKPHCLPNQQPQRHSDEEEKEEAEEPDGFGRPTKLGQFQFEHTGPFEPLVLSSQGEVPVVQVILCLRSFCL